MCILINNNTKSTQPNVFNVPTSNSGAFGCKDAMGRSDLIFPFVWFGVNWDRGTPLGEYTPQIRYRPVLEK